jgi:hypothetical protein
MSASFQTERVAEVLVRPASSVCVALHDCIIYYDGGADTGAEIYFRRRSRKDALEYTRGVVPDLVRLSS